MAMPTHIVAVGGIVENEQGEVLLVKTYHGGWVFPGGLLSTSDETSDSRWVAKDTALEMITSSAIRTRFQAYLEFVGNVAYIVYETKPEFKVAMSREI
ncbi:NUDIX domain-containing protein [Paenibacillus sonchi]|uniref:NUDIX domain-containing protein n=1 Tax=Paenibacillus sonchi TaxID=373687 RepID=A0A974PBB2_9BACL|nr:NUDIX domain-containing protein [Paenibacillus sonchi]QQZ60228.1 NUDIX domain-containing protein [Paenibacillus sonchi]